MWPHYVILHSFHHVIYFAVARCEDLIVENGMVVVEDPIQDGSEATYSCDQGFDLEGESRRRCQSDGAWSGEAPSCRGKRKLGKGNMNFRNVSLLLCISPRMRTTGKS